MKQLAKLQSVSRRDFLKLTGMASGGLVLGALLPIHNPVWAGSAQTSNELNLFISINSDNSIDIICHRSEMGQGARTGLPQIIADELCADWSKVNVVQGLANPAYGSQNTDGSTSVREFYTTLREMGAGARAMLEQAAAQLWRVDVTEVYAENSFVLQKGSGRKVSFGYLAEAASKLSAPKVSELKFKSPKDFTLIGKPLPIVDMRAMVTGNTTFGQDIQLNDMLYVSIERSPVVGAKVNGYDKEATLKVAGVVDVFEMPAPSMPVGFNPLSGVAVIATNTWAALQGRKTLNIQWQMGDNQSHDSAKYLADLKSNIVNKGKVVRSRGDAYAAMEQANSSIQATYTVPYLVHAPMEPPAAAAVVKNGECEIWACTQNPQGVQQSVAGALGIEAEKVKVNTTLLGGAFGRKSKPDFAVEAALLARYTGKAVKVVWSREDDIQHGYYHAISAQHYGAGLGTNGEVTSWVQRTAFPSISWTFTGTTDEASDGELSLGFADLPFAVDNLSCETHKATAHLRIGWMRSVSNIHHGFAIGSFVDEVADAAKIPTQDMWHQLIGSDRMVDTKAEGFNYSNYDEAAEKFPIDTKRLKYVLDLLMEKLGAAQQAASGEGWGISVHRSFVSYVAVATKVKVSEGKVSVLEMHSVIDAGTVVNPDRVKSQLEGAMIFGLSIALMGEISVKDGAVVQSNYNDYPVLRMHQSPPMYTYIVESDAPPGGVGEPGVPPVAASLANAIFHASGTRIRDLPINKHFSV
jgi:isoquinoline 1-oxidoreductase subunit beta